MPSPSTATSDLPSPPRLLPELVERWTASTPDAPAIRYANETWTVGQLWQRIGRLASALESLGLRRGGRVAFLDKNHPACIELTMAAASLGGATVIINWRLSADEVGYILQDSGATILMVGEEFAELATSALADTDTVRVVRLAASGDDDYESLLAAHSPRMPDSSVSPTDGAVVVYSSGTTGRPKGVVLSHEALVAHTVNLSSRIPFDPGDCNLVAMPMFHVGGICWAFLSIYSRVPSIVVRNSDASSLLSGIKSGATHAFFVPPVVSGLVQGGAAVTQAMQTLKLLGYGAAPMPVSLLRTALEAWPHIDFVQVYGQTEIAGVAVTLQPADHRDPNRPHLLTAAGQPLPGTEVKIVDPLTTKSVAPGEQGEIWFRSRQVMSEYLNQPEATAETITADGWLRTGDIGRTDDDGYLYVEDRIKDMIITGGENVYGPEVERVLAEHPAIVDAAVIGVPDAKWGETVKAVVVTSSTATAEEIIAFCRDSLAGYKCPTSVEFVEALPRNASGKLLKREIRAPYWTDNGRRV